MTYPIDFAPFPKDLSSLRVLVTNDDGIHADGLKVLETIARQLTDDVWVVAPEMEQSGAGHSLSINRPVRYRPLGVKRFSVDGTPTDCVLVAIKEIMQSQEPHLILSGVNNGRNVGEDVTYSGTVSAALEGTLLGIRSIAFSTHNKPSLETAWSTVKELAPGILENLLQLSWARGVLINVNFPGCPATDIKGIRAATQGFHDMRHDDLVPVSDPFGRRYYWLGSARCQESYPTGSDLAYINQNYITISPLHLDMTHAGMLKKLRDKFPG